MKTLTAPTKPIFVKKNIAIEREMDTWIKRYAERTGRKYQGVIKVAVETYRQIAEQDK